MKGHYSKIGLSILLALCLLLSGCGGISTTASPDESKATTASENAVPTPDDELQGAGGYVFMYKGVTIEIDAPAAVPIAELGQPLSYFEATSCAFGEQDKVWTYNGFRIDTYQIDGIDYFSDVVLTSDTVFTTEGVHIGDSANDMLSAYGTPDISAEDHAIYENGDMKLLFLLENDTITTIEYLSKKLD